MLFNNCILILAFVGTIMAFGERQSPINIQHGATKFNGLLAGLDITKTKNGKGDDQNDGKRDSIVSTLFNIIQHGANKFNGLLAGSEITKTKNTKGDDQTETWTVKNDGKGVTMTPISHSFSFVQMPENEKFNLLQFHFHWRGSEHQLNGELYPAEVHLVHQSQTNSSQLAVIGFLFETVDNDNENLEPLVKHLKDIPDYKNLISTTDFELGSMFPMTIDKYYRYEGSLTTPSYAEIVDWYVVESPKIVISNYQILQFQKLVGSSGKLVLNNAREIQALNGRIVQRNFDHFLNLIRRSY